MQPSTKSPTCPRPAVPSLPRTLAKSPGKDQPPPNEKVNTSTGRTPPGVILQVGIECVITHGQSKFKATVRYIGKVLFDNESYVGVEVPTDNSDLPADLQWTDGIVDGVRVSEWSTSDRFPEHALIFFWKVLRFGSEEEVRDHESSLWREASIQRFRKQQRGTTPAL